MGWESQPAAIATIEARDLILLLGSGSLCYVPLAKFNCIYSFTKTIKVLGLYEVEPAWRKLSQCDDTNLPPTRILW